MITLFTPKFNHFSQSVYDSVVNTLQLHRLECTCGHSGCLSRHGFYRRSVLTEEGTRSIRILRVICGECGRTHALLPVSLVPYCQIPLLDQYQVIQAFEHNGDRNAVCKGAGLDENHVKSILLRYRRFWQQRLLSEAIPLEPIRILIRSCFARYRMQFMQIRRTRNKVFALPT